MLSPSRCLRHSLCSFLHIDNLFTLGTRAISSTSSANASNPSTDILTSPGWALIQQQLDLLPVFACADEGGLPLQCKQDGEPLARFYTCVADAKTQLASTCEALPGRDYDVVPYPLGQALQLSLEGKGVLVPSMNNLIAAGLPPHLYGAPVHLQEVPLFCCMEISEELPDGKPSLPLFMSNADAEEAVANAVAEAEAAGGEPVEPPEIESMPLLHAVKALVTVPGTPAFKFVPPSASLAHIQEYLA